MSRALSSALGNGWSGMVQPANVKEMAVTDRIFLKVDIKLAHGERKKMLLLRFCNKNYIFYPLHTELFLVGMRAE